jgi:hypothetical protein
METSEIDCEVRGEISFHSHWYPDQNSKWWALKTTSSPALPLGEGKEEHVSHETCKHPQKK